MPVSEVTTHHRPKKFHENSFIMDCVNHLKQMSSYNTIILWYLKIELRFLGQDPCFWSLFKSSFQVQVKLTNKQSRKKKKILDRDTVLSCSLSFLWKIPFIIYTSSDAHSWNDTVCATCFTCKASKLKGTHLVAGWWWRLMPQKLNPDPAIWMVLWADHHSIRSISCFQSWSLHELPKRSSTKLFNHP